MFGGRLACSSAGGHHTIWAPTLPRLYYVRWPMIRGVGMFESAELGHSVDKRDYDEQLPKLRAALLDAQLRVFQRGEFPVVVVTGGVDGGGKGDVVKLL